jgi:hypothetical protein
VTSCLDRLFALVMAQLWKSVDGVAIVGTEFSLRVWLPWAHAIAVSGQLVLGTMVGGS